MIAITERTITELRITELAITGYHRANNTMKHTVSVRIQTHGHRVGNHEFSPWLYRGSLHSNVLVDVSKNYES